MPEKIYQILEAMAFLKHYILVFFGFIVQVLFFNRKPVQYIRFGAALIFMFVVVYLIREYVQVELIDQGLRRPWYFDWVVFLLGMFSHNIVAGLFRWWNVNENELMRKTKRWWNSDNSPKKK